MASNCTLLYILKAHDQGEFTVMGVESNHVFTFEMDDHEWYDYDEIAANEVSLTEFESRIEGFKK